MQRSSGFTLIEIMIVVAIAGILAALAWPSYQDGVRRSNRAEAKTELMDLAQRLQKCYTTYGVYNDPPGASICAAWNTVNGSYITRGKGFYRITIAPLPAPATPENSFELTATAILAPQTKDDLVNGCNELTLDNTGRKEPIICW